MADKILLNNGIDHILLNDSSGVVLMSFIEVLATVPLPLKVQGVSYRDNLITQPDALDDAYWTLAGDASIAATNVNDPDGFPLAESVTVNPGAAVLQKTGLEGTVAGKSYDLEIWAKGNGTDTMEWGTYDDVAGYRLSVITPPTSWTKYTISNRAFSGAVTDARMLPICKISLASGGTFSVCRVLMREAQAERLITASLALPLGMTGVLSNPAFISFNKALPLAVTATLQNPLSIVFSKSLPLGLTAVLAVDNNLSFSKALPLSISAALQVGVQINASLQLPLNVSAALNAALNVNANVPLPIGLVATLQLVESRIITAITPLPLSVIAELERGRVIDAVLRLPLGLQSIILHEIIPVIHGRHFFSPEDYAQPGKPKYDWIQHLSDGTRDVGERQD